MGGKASAASKNRWNAKAYDRINLVVPKGKRDEIREYAAAQGKSLNGYLVLLIQQDMGEQWDVETMGPQDRFSDKA